VKSLAVPIYHRKESCKHCANILLRVPHQQKPRHANSAAYDQFAEAFVFGHQGAAFPPRTVNNGTIADAPPRVSHCQDIMTSASKSLDQTTVQALVGEKSHAASGWPNWMSSLRR
jgi:hypothetical protein